MRKPNDIKRAKSNSRSLGQFLRGRERWFHVAKLGRMVDNPAKLLHEALGQPFFGPAMIPLKTKGFTWRQGKTPLTLEQVEVASA